MSEELLALLRKAVAHQCKLDQLLGELEHQTAGMGNWTLLQNKIVNDYIRQLAAGIDGETNQKVTLKNVEELRALLKPPSP